MKAARRYVTWDNFWWAFLGALFVTFVASTCTSCATSQAHVRSRSSRIYDTPGIARAAQSSFRIRIFCGEKWLGVGSGVAVSPRFVMTARHVVDACEDQADKKITFIAQDTNGVVYRLELDKKPLDDDVDAARLRIVDDEEFPVWADVAKYIPRIGQTTIHYTGDGASINYHPFYFKHGYVSDYSNGVLTVAVHGVPGNSGSGVFDKDGNLLAILVQGDWDNSEENFIDAWSPEAWQDLIPTPGDYLSVDVGVSVAP